MRRPHEVLARAARVRQLVAAAVLLGSLPASGGSEMAAAPPAAAKLHFHPGPARPAPAPPLLAAAQAAYQHDDLARAQTLYRQALAEDPASPDALAGLGAIALRQKHLQEATGLFREALQRFPQDPLALAGLSLSLLAATALDAGAAGRTESALRDSLAEHPEAVGVAVALGALLARQQRWAEASQAYSRALAMAPDDPDLAHDLAVSLDHLGRTALAAHYYRQALGLAAEAPAHFAADACRARLQTLEMPEAAR